jgi:lipopolysaccharide exporter
VDEPLESSQPGSHEAVGRLASRGAAWMFGLNISNRVLGLVRTAIIARLLLPEDLGLFGIAMLAQSVIEIFSMFGLTSALVRKTGDVSDYLDTAWVISFLRGLAVAVLMVLLAPYIAGFFHQPAATNLIRLLAITSALTGFGNPASVNLRRELRFGAVFVMSLVPGLVDIAVSLIIAFLYATPMALIFGLVARVGVWLILSYALVPYLPRLRFDLARAREMMSYGKWITWTTMLSFLYGQGDDIVVGRLLGAADLGVYQIGYRYSNLPTTEITRVIQVVALPTYAKVQGDPERLRRAFLEALSTTSLVSIALAGYIWVITPDFVQLVLGSSWSGVVPVMRLLAIWGAAESVSEIPIALFQAVGKPALATRRLLAKTICLAVLIYPMLHWWGLRGVCVAVLLSSLPATVWSVVNGASLVGARLRLVVSTLSVPVVASGLAVAGTLLLGLVLPNGSVESLIAITALCLAVYAVVAVVARAAGYTGMTALLVRLKTVFARRADS